MDRRSAFPRLLVVIDALTVTAAFVLSYYLRRWIPALGFKPLGPIDHYLWILLATIPIWWLLLFLNGGYQEKVERPLSIVSLAVKCGLGGLLTLALLLFLIKFETFNRSLLLLFVAVQTAMLIVTRAALSAWLAVARRSGKTARHALVVVSADSESEREAALLIGRMHQNRAAGVALTGVLVFGKPSDSPGGGAVPVRGSVEDLPDLLHEEVVDEVYFVVPPALLEQVSDYLKLCEEMGVEGKVLAQLYRPALARPYLEESFDLPFFSFAPTPLYVGQRYAKALIDFVGAVALLAVLALPMALIALAVKISSRGPVLFRQERGGLHGRRFSMNKFRTMVPDADRLKADLADQNQMSGPVFKLVADPRVTPIGRWLRRASLDELPQLFNVLKGDMSLVGPRPLPLAETAAIHGPLRRRFSMKPGMTGLWQASGRSSVDFHDWMRLDLEYVDNWSLRLDMEILLRTIFAVASGRGAH
ncbi:MAG TPA: sugar transferase [Verrucomicrobiae bacterium]|jgi:exopolysaccharide biosynthesis polyprenyl glycosylphosphotransferase|nr:sugar transferase [Verrucomicrobiae bacterium]